MAVRFFSLFACLAVLMMASSVVASSGSTDRSAAIGMLDRSAAEIRDDLNPSQRIGALKRHELRRKLASVVEERDRLAAGGTVDEQRLASLTGRVDRVDRTAESVIANRAESRREVTERRLRGVGPRLGAMERIKLRDDLESLDELIADLESGKEVDLARVDRVIGLMSSDIPQTPEQRLEALGTKRAIAERRLNGSPRLGAMERLEIRSEIERIDQIMRQLESEI